MLEQMRGYRHMTSYEILAAMQDYLLRPPCDGRVLRPLVNELFHREEVASNARLRQVNAVAEQVLPSHVETAPRAVEADVLRDLGAALLHALGEDPQREGLRETPRRWAAWWREFLEYDPGTLDTSFEAVHADQLVVLRGVRVWSVCEHHLLPFTCTLQIGYLTGERVLGISKLARIAHKHAHKLQLQERLCEQVATELGELTASPSVAVMAHGEHLCMASRGIRTDATMITSVMRGRFRDSGPTRDEFLRLWEAR